MVSSGQPILKASRKMKKLRNVGFGNFMSSPAAIVKVGKDETKCRLCFSINQPTNNKCIGKRTEEG